MSNKTTNTTPADVTENGNDDDLDNESTAPVATPKTDDGTTTTFCPVVQDADRFALIKKVVRYRRSLQSKDEPRYAISSVYLELLEAAITPEVIALWNEQATKAPAARQNGLEGKSAEELTKKMDLAEARLNKLRAMLAGSSKP